MNKYNNGKIYKIVDNTNDNVYYGSTVITLQERLQRHKYQKCVAKSIINNGDYNIILIEDYPCESKQQLELRERYYIENNICINKNIPGRTDKERREDNKEIISQTKKEWYKTNKEKILQHTKEHYEINKEQLSQEKLKQYHYLKTWGGDKRFNNNLLQIDINLFQ